MVKVEIPSPASVCWATSNTAIDQGDIYLNFRYILGREKYSISTPSGKILSFQRREKGKKGEEKGGKREEKGRKRGEEEKKMKEEKRKKIVSCSKPLIFLLKTCIICQAEY